MQTKKTARQGHAVGCTQGQMSSKQVLLGAAYAWQGVGLATRGAADSNDFPGSRQGVGTVPSGLLLALGQWGLVCGNSGVREPEKGSIRMWAYPAAQLEELTSLKPASNLGQSPRTMREMGHSKLVPWDNPEGWDGEGRGRGLWDGGTHVHPWLIHVDIWSKPPQYCKGISLQLIIKKKTGNIFIRRRMDK